MSTLINEATGRDVRIGRMVAALCELHGVQHRELAQMIAMPATTLSNKIKGSRPWRADELDRIAAALGVPSALLMLDPESVLDTLMQPGTSINYRYA